MIQGIMPLDYHCVDAIEIRSMIDLSHTQVAKTSAEKLQLGEDFERHFSLSLLYHAEAHIITYYSLKLHTLSEADCLVQADESDLLPRIELSKNTLYNKIKNDNPQLVQRRAHSGPSHSMGLPDLV